MSSGTHPCDSDITVLSVWGSKGLPRPVGYPPSLTLCPLMSCHTARDTTLLSPYTLGSHSRKWTEISHLSFWKDRSLNLSLILNPSVCPLSSSPSFMWSVPLVVVTSESGPEGVLEVSSTSCPSPLPF